jgi:hypothetical protein
VKVSSKRRIPSRAHASPMIFKRKINNNKIIPNKRLSHGYLEKAMLNKS